jgi:hypothetical protein
MSAIWGGGVYKRLEALGQNYRPDQKVPFAIMQRPVNLFRNEKHVLELIQAIKRKEAQFGQPISLLIVDTLAAVMVGASPDVTVTREACV